MTTLPDLGQRTGFRVRLGFVALLDSAPLIVAREMGLFEAQGLEVGLSREVSWASLRDKVGAGLLDGAQMLAPMPLAASLGLGAPAMPITTSLVLSRNGNAITVSAALHRQLVAAGATAKSPLASAQALARVARRATRPLRFATVYPWSCHYLQFRDWLAVAQLVPGEDLEMTAIPPSRMLDAFRKGEIDGCCVGEPWNSLAEIEGLGRILVAGHQIWQNAPEKVLGMRQDWAQQHPEMYRRLLVALLQACRWIEDPDNQGRLLRILALPPYLDRAAQQLQQGSRGLFHPRIQQHFFRDCANFPWLSQASWLASRMKHWGQIDADADVESVVNQVYRPDIYRDAAQRAGLDAPVIDGKPEGRHLLPYTVAGVEGPLSVASDGLLGEQQYPWP